MAVDNALERLPPTPEIRVVHVQRDEDRSEDDIGSPFTRNHALGNFYSALGMPAEARLEDWDAIETKSRNLKKLLSALEDVEERLRLEDSELAKLNITYVYDDESGDNPSFGHADTDNGETNDFVYYPDTDYIWLNHYDTYKNGVYTLTATYVEDNINKYSTNFDIVFERPTT